MVEKLPDNIVDAAVYWAESGIPVFPCNSKKAPLTSNGFYDAETDPKKVRALFEFYGTQASLIGGRMGDGVFVVDVDLYKGDDVKAWLKARIDEGSMPETRVHETMSGGLHFFYEGDVDCTAPAAGIEIKGNGGYVIMPGAGNYKVVSEGLAPASPKLMDAIRFSISKSKGSTIAQLQSNILSGADFHNSLTQLAAKMAMKGMNQIEIQKELLDILNSSTAANPGNDRHHRWRNVMADAGGELSRIVLSAYRKFNDDAIVDEIAELAGFDMLEMMETSSKVFTQLGNFEAPTPKQVEFSPDKWPFEGQGYFADEHIDYNDTNFVMYPIYAENETVVLFAEPKTGKTALALTTALHISCGMDLGSFKVPVAGPCLYYALEGSRAIRLRVESWKKQMITDGIKLPDRIPLFVVEKTANFLKEKNRVAAADQIIAANEYSKKFGEPLKVVYLDTLTKAMSGGDQNSVEDTSDLFDLVSLLRNGGVTATIVFVHHKSRQGNLRGSSNIEAEPDMLLDVSKKGHVIAMKIARARSIEDGAVFHFAIANVDLGKTKQGHPLSGMFVSPISQQDGVTMENHLDVQKLAQMRNVITQLGKGGQIEAGHVLVEWTELGLIDASTVRGNKVPPTLSSAKAQEALHKAAADAGGTIYGDFVIRPIIHEKLVIGFKVAAASF